MGPFWRTIQSWWDIRNLPNVLLLHFNNLKSDMEGEIRRIAGFLEIDVDEATWPAIVEHCTFDYMKDERRCDVARIRRPFPGRIDNFLRIQRHQRPLARYLDRRRSRALRQIRERQLDLRLRALA